MIWSSLARNRSPSLVASCFFGRIDPSDPASNHGSPEEGIPKRNRKVPGSRDAKPCNPKSAPTPKNDPPSTTWPFFTGDYFLLLDTDKDGFVTLTEFMAGADRNFTRCDLDRNGRIDTAECRQALQRRPTER
jgi:hypothetical protein